MQKDFSKKSVGRVFLHRSVFQSCGEKIWRILGGAMLLLALLAAVLLAADNSPAKALEAPATSGLVAGNYCFSCHLREDPRLQTVTEWQGGIGRTDINPCPAAIRIAEELYYTERLLLMIDRGIASLPAPVISENKLSERIEGAAQSYLRLSDTPFSGPTAMASLDAFVSEAQVARYRLGKINTTIHNLIEQQKENRVLLVAGLVTLVVLASLLWGMRHTGFDFPLVRWLRQPRSGLVMGMAGVLLILAIFALPLFQVFPAEVAEATELEQEQAAKLDEAQRAAGTADRIQARAMVLAQIAATWQPLDREKSNEASAAAVETLSEGQKLAEALWGRALAAEEVAVGFTPALEKARLAAVNLEAARQWPWGAAQAAIALAEEDPERAAALLQSLPAPASGLYGDLQRRMLALAWLRLDGNQAEKYAAQIRDAMICSWTWRELGQLAGQQPDYFSAASQAASAIADPLQRARSLQELALVTGEARYFALAEQSLAEAGGDIPEQALAFAWADLAVESSQQALVQRIPENVPAARAMAWRGLGQFEAAWQAALAITDPYERAQAQAAIAVSARSPEMATQIQVPLFRDRALRDLIRTGVGGDTLLDQMILVYPRFQALLALGRYSEAWQAFKDGSLKLSETYPLVELAIGWGQVEPEAAAPVIDAITRESDRVQVLLALAGQSAPFEQPQLERALALALAGRVRGDATAPARFSLLLAQRLMAAPQCQLTSADRSGILPVCQQQAVSLLEQALEAALKISMK